MSDKVLFSSDYVSLDGRQVRVTAERGYGDVVTLLVSDEGGEHRLFLHDMGEVSWLGNALVDAWAAVMKE